MILFIIFILCTPFITSFTIKYNYNVPFIAEIHNLNVNKLSTNDIEDLNFFFKSTPVLIFKNQILTPTQHYEFCKLFDKQHTNNIVHPFKDTLIPECPQIALRGKGYINDVFGVKDTFIQNGQSFRYNRVWHQDLVGCKNNLPTKISSMYMLKVPEKGGSTLFASLENGYDNLCRSHNKFKYLNLKCCYSSYHSLNAFMDYTGYNRIDKYWSNNIENLKQLKNEVIIQPLVVYPDAKSRRKTLMLSPNKFYSFFGIDPEKSQEILREICSQYIFRSDNIGTIAYKKNDLIIFNNRKVIHTSTPTEEIEGDRLFSLLYLDTKESYKPIHLRFD
tara:strand:+ start:10301 stop:11296 length:996 start_codon:yes stop_codon:yes gene_type:complete